MAFKPKPTQVYREEVRSEEEPLRNAVRQTFNEDNFQSWKRYWENFADARYNRGVEVSFSVGTITWEDE